MLIILHYISKTRLPFSLGYIYVIKSLINFWQHFLAQPSFQHRFGHEAVANMHVTYTLTCRPLYLWKIDVNIIPMLASLIQFLLEYLFDIVIYFLLVRSDNWNLYSCCETFFFLLAPGKRTSISVKHCTSSKLYAPSQHNGINPMFTHNGEGTASEKIQECWINSTEDRHFFSGQAGQVSSPAHYPNVMHHHNTTQRHKSNVYPQ